MVYVSGASPECVLAASWAAQVGKLQHAVDIFEEGCVPYELPQLPFRLDADDVRIPDRYELLFPELL